MAQTPPASEQLQAGARGGWRVSQHLLFLVLAALGQAGQRHLVPLSTRRTTSPQPHTVPGARGLHGPGTHFPAIPGTTGRIATCTFEL